MTAENESGMLTVRRICEPLVRQAKLGITGKESPYMERFSQPPLSSVVPLLVTVKVKRTQRII